MSDKVHFFDLDYTLWEIPGKAWIIDKEKPSKCLFKIENEDLVLIENGYYKNFDYKITYNGETYYISPEIREKLSKLNLTLDRIGISYREFKDENLINKSQLLIYENIYKHINPEDKICILTARHDRRKHSNVLNKLRQKLLEKNLRIFKIFFVGDMFDTSISTNIAIKKSLVLLEHTIGLKIENNVFVDKLQDKFLEIHFYDDNEANIWAAKNLQELLENIFKRTKDEKLKKYVISVIKNKPKVYIHKSNSNDINPFDTTEILIKEPIYYPINNENFKYLKPYKLFETEENSEKDILSLFDEWDINYKFKDGILELSFKYPDRVTNHEIETINRVCLKLKDLKFLRIISSDDDKMLLREEQLEGLKVPEGVKVITGFYGIMKQYYPEIKQYFDELFKGIEIKTTKKHPDSIYYLKDNEVIMEQDLKTKIIYCHYDKIWRYFQSDFNLKYESDFNLKYGEIRQIMKGILDEHFKLGSLTPTSISYLYSKYWKKISNWD